MVERSPYWLAKNLGSRIQNGINALRVMLTLIQVLSGSPRGLQIFRLMETGELVPSIIVLHLLTEAMVTIENINRMYSIAQKAKKQWFNILEGGQNLWRQGKRLFTWCLPLQHRPGEEELETAPVSLFTAFNFEIFCQISKATQYYCLL